MFLDLHCHTRYSFDCRMEPAKVLSVARSRGLDAIAITDHNEIEGALEARCHARDGVHVIVGEEIDTEAGDILGLFLEEKIETRDPLEAIAQIHRQGGIAVLPHPFSKGPAIQESVARELDACEGLNARHARGGSRVIEFARRYDLSLTAGSDAHFYHEIGRARTFVAAGTVKEALEEILRGSTVLEGRPSSLFNRLAGVAIHSLKTLGHPVPEEDRHE